MTNLLMRQIRRITRDRKQIVPYISYNTYYFCDFQTYQPAGRELHIRYQITSQRRNQPADAAHPVRFIQIKTVDPMRSFIRFYRLKKWNHYEKGTAHHDETTINLDLCDLHAIAVIEHDDNCSDKRELCEFSRSHIEDVRGRYSKQKR